ncbi:hypothetical protein BYT27DRAFT_7211772 [Phlegmacium glaucopus]|nr:hypothetical protein BYT27DRAFT_7211772 [Phlegmacium glaucopus]
MGRWTQYDEDDYRLPEGMKRIGYDSDTTRYYFRDQDGSVWQGAEGAEYGEMTRVLDDDENRGDDVEAYASPRTQSRGYQPLSTDPSRPMADHSTIHMSYRKLFPFFLIIAVVLLLVWRLVVSPGLSIPTKKCPEGTSSYWAQPGDNCWELSRKNGWSLEKFKEINSNVVCDPLMPGTSMCLPPPKKQTRRRP